MTWRTLSNQILTIFLLVFAATQVRADIAGRCLNEEVVIDTSFPTGALHQCRIEWDDTVVITIKPEDPKVTIEQPWYAFRVTAREPTQVQIRLEFVNGYARYWPKLSRDLETWQRADESAVTISDSQKTMTLVVDTDIDSVYVAAQEVLPLSWYDDWFADLQQHPDVEISTIGQSVDGRDLLLANTPNRLEAVILLGRQHPAEVPGALAMRLFVDTVLADTELARGFRERFTLLIIPLINPDGVARGHWRHNSGQTDLNRDWGPFTQPETTAVAELLERLEDRQIQPRLMLDFHATKETRELLFYTQAADEQTDPENFDNNWFAAVRKRLPEFEFTHDPRPSQTNPNTKGFFYREYGIPAFTYELGDAADRDLLRSTTPIFAEEMMRELLRTD